MSKAGPQLDFPLWTFSLEVYAQQGVQQECLALQDEFGVDVNLLLFFSYAGAVEGIRLGEREIAEASQFVSDWHGEVVRGLRAVRRSLKTVAAQTPLAEPASILRTYVQAAELEAERIEQTMLWVWLRSRHAEKGRGFNADALAANIGLFLEFNGVRAADPVPSLTRAARSAAQRNVGL